MHVPRMQIRSAAFSPDGGQILMCGERSTSWGSFDLHAPPHAQVPRAAAFVPPPSCRPLVPPLGGVAVCHPGRPGRGAWAQATLQPRPPCTLHACPVGSFAVASGSTRCPPAVQNRPHPCDVGHHAGGAHGSDTGRARPCRARLQAGDPLTRRQASRAARRLGLAAAALTPNPNPNPNPIPTPTPTPT